MGRLVIQRNSIFNNGEDGILVKKLQGLLEISENEIKRNGALALFGMVGWGIRAIETYPFITISYNEIVENADGISIEGIVPILNLTIFQNNIISAFSGIYIINIDSGMMALRKNMIRDMWEGLEIEGFYGQADISDNTIMDIKNKGIYLNKVNDTRLTYNGIYNSRSFALVLSGQAKNTNITLNDFSFNLRKFKNPTVSQAIDNGTNNIFNKNYWSDWNSPDYDGDNYVDYPYQINGTAQNQDLLPRALRPTSFAHMLLKPFFNTPTSGEAVSGVLNVSWIPAIDTANHPITYDLYYSPDVGTTWVLIQTAISNEFYLWNTETLANGDYLLKIVATDGFGATAEDKTGLFSLNNGNGSIPHELTPITLLTPNGGEILSGSISITWTEVNDSHGHQVYYSLYYSADAGSTWNLIIANLTVTSYSWDTTTLPDGEYLLKVTATDGKGLSVEDTSDEAFIIQNNSQTTQTSTQTSTHQTPTTTFSDQTTMATSNTSPTVSKESGGFLHTLTTPMALTIFLIIGFKINRNRRRIKLTSK